MSSDIFRCVGRTRAGKRCKREAVRAVKTPYYLCPHHEGAYVRDTVLEMKALI